VKGTSRRIKSRVTRLQTITVHISPHLGGLAPETRDVVAYINDEAERRRTGVKFTATANRIEATGPIEAAANTSTFGGLMLMEAIAAGYLEGEEAVLRRGNSQHRKKLRRHDKTKAGNRDKAAREQAIKNRDATRRIAEAGDAFIGPSAVVPGSWPKAWIDGVYMPILNPEKLRDDDNG
jgi:hypothetical protein